MSEKYLESKSDFFKCNSNSYLDEANNIEKDKLLNILASKFHLNSKSIQMKEIENFINYLLNINVLIGENRNVNV